jgi:hypothetical protein
MHESLDSWAGIGLVVVGMAHHNELCSVLKPGGRAAIAERTGAPRDVVARGHRSVLSE